MNSIENIGDVRVILNVQSISKTNEHSCKTGASFYTRKNRKIKFPCRLRPELCIKVKKISMRH